MVLTAGVSPALSLHFSTKAVNLVNAGVPKLVELCESDVWGALCSLWLLMSPCAVHFHFPSSNLSTAQISAALSIIVAWKSAEGKELHFAFLKAWAFLHALIWEQKYFFSPIAHFQWGLLKPWTWALQSSARSGKIGEKTEDPEPHLICLPSLTGLGGGSG